MQVCQTWQIDKKVFESQREKGAVVGGRVFPQALTDISSWIFEPGK